MFDNDPFSSNDMFSAQPQPQVQTGGRPQQQQQQKQQFQNNNQQESKYQILNMFWLINLKASQQDAKFLQNETNFAAISYNLNFCNLRVEFCNATADSIQNSNIICWNKLNRVTSCTLYSTAMFQLVASQEQEIICYEQIVNYTGEDWQTKRPHAKLSKTENNSIVLTIDKHCFEFSDWQKDALVYSCKFALNQGFTLSGQNIIKR